MNADPPAMTCFHEAVRLRDLHDRICQAVGEILGRPDACESLALIFPLDDPPGRALLCTEDTLSLSHHFMLVGVKQALDDGTGEPAAACYCEASLRELLAIDGRADMLGSVEAGPSVMARLQRRGRLAAALRMGLCPDAPRPDDAALRRIARLMESIGEAAPAVVQGEILRWQVGAMQAVNETMMRPLTAPDRAILLEQLTEMLGRHFHFSRTFIALLHRDANAWRCEMHAGFPPDFEPFTVHADRREDELTRAVEAGRIVLRDRGEAPLEIERRFPPADPPDAGAVLAPFGIGAPPLGFIYADSPRTDDVFVLRNVFETFVQLASTAVANLEARLTAQHRAETDSLTGAFNRHFLDRVLEVEIPRVKRYKSPISMLMIDLVDFKKTNDAYGHVFGDYILRETASIIQSNVREPDIVVRYGGDEFVVLMVNTNEEQARLVRERIERAFIERNRSHEDEKMMIDISIGLCSADETTIDNLLEEADRSMYRNKAEQRKRQVIEALLGVAPARSDAVDSVIQSLLGNLERKEPFYRDHARRTAYLCLLLGRERGLTGSALRSLALAALLHDVGKASLPGEMLQRPGPLGEGEMRAIQGHPQMGEEFFQGLPHLEGARPMIRHHHERWDGRTTGEFPGYPFGLRGEAIPLGARILKLADSADAMLSDRPYRKARTAGETREILTREAGASFDPDLVRLLLRRDDWIEKRRDGEALIELYRAALAECDDTETDVAETALREMV